MAEMKRGRVSPASVLDHPGADTAETTGVLPDVRDAANRRRDPDPDPERYAEELGVGEFEAAAAIEALTVEGEVLA